MQQKTNDMKTCMTCEDVAYKLGSKSNGSAFSRKGFERHQHMRVQDNVHGNYFTWKRPARYDLDRSCTTREDEKPDKTGLNEVGGT